VTPAIFPRALVFSAILASTSLFAGFREDIGFSELQTAFGSLPNGSSLKIAHIEYVRDGKWAPEMAGELEGKSITYSPASPTGYSYHGDEVGRVLYGSTSSVIPAVSQIRAFEAWNYYDNSLNTSKGIAPVVADWDLENHSYISNAGLSTNEGGRRMDFRIDRDGVTATVVLENGTGTVPPLFGNTYNTIVVGSSTGSHSRGGTTREVVGRVKPDIVGTANWTSYAGPIVGSSAGLLIAKTKADSSLAMAKRPEVIKALLMAGATKEEFPTWSRSSTAPIDPIYGAGEVNVNNSYGMLVTGRQAASPSAIRSSRGWDLNTVGTGSSLLYFFTIGSGQTGTISAVLTWHRTVSPINGAWNQGVSASVDNLDLRLYRANSQFETGDLLQDSVSAIDNVEHIFLRDVAEGTYVLVVGSVSGTKQFGLAWNVSGVTSQPPTVTAPAITTQPAAKTVTEGSSVSFSVLASGTSPFTYQWRKNGSAISGATGSSFSVAAAALSDAGTYTVVVSNSAGSATSNGAYLTVNTAVSAPAITTQPAAKTVTEGSSVSFSVLASGTSPFTYQWRKNGSAISGATGSSFSIAAAALSDAGTYTVVVSNSAGSATSNGAFLTVNLSVVTPMITTQPSPKSVTEGASVSFSVVASGTSPFSYQWRRNSVAIQGASGASLSIASASLADEGSYSVVVTNSAGSATSSAAFLSVSSAAIAPSISSQPAPATAQEGGGATFSVSASGTSPFTYQWLKDGVSISGATSSSLSITSVSLASAGIYSVVVSNSAGSATSSGASLTINSSVVAPTITTQPVPKTVSEGASVSFSVAAGGTSPFTYQWRKKGIAIAGATGSTFSIPAVALTDEGNYTVVVSNSAGTVASNGAYLTVNTAASASPPAITSQPTPASAIEGGNATFSVTASGTSPFNYQWRKDGVAISGATGSSLTLSSLTAGQAGTYSVVVSNSAGSATSNGALLTVHSAVKAPAITSQPVGANTNEGSSVSFSVSASGTSPMTYQWRKDGANVVGANSANFSVQNTTLADAGSYTVVVSNPAGSATSNSAILQVAQAELGAPTITNQPVPAIVPVGSSAKFAVSAKGSGSLSYQWRKNGVAISGAVAPTLSISSAQVSDAASYSVRVANSAGSVESSGAALTVQSTPSVAAGGKLGNISSRAKVEAGSGILISGFVVTGDQPKTLIVRAVGPTLSSYNLTGLLKRPMIRIYSGSNLIEEIPSGGRSPSAEVAREAAILAGAFPLPENSLDCVVVRSFTPGAYTVHVFGEDGGKGIAIVEVYDLDASNSGSRVVNLSTRSHVGRNNEILIPGVSITGTSPKQVLIRAVGPGLRDYDVDGVLERPKIALYQGTTLVTENTGWTTSPNPTEIAAVSDRVGAFALKESSWDSALLVTLAPGGYTLHITGSDGGTGVVLAEVFEVPSN
jgi:hypothetical protein